MSQLRTISLTIILLFSPLVSQAQSRLFIMLDVDSTIIDRIYPNDKASAAKLKDEGFQLQFLQFHSLKNNASKFFPYYQHKMGENSNDFMSRINIHNISAEKILVEERIVIRPTIQKFLEDILKLGFETHILICSSNDNGRNRNLVNNLRLQINGKKFKNIVEFIPREKFRVVLLTEDGYDLPVKSAQALRANYEGKFGQIHDEDYVILIDQLPDFRFIVADPKRDKNMQIKPFLINEYDHEADVAMMEESLVKIKEFLKN
jgi:hypothetical protein